MSDRLISWAANITTVILAFLGILLIIAIIVLLCLGFVGGILWIDNHTSFPAQSAEIEQLRSDVSKVAASDSEDVVGQVTEWNQYIKSKQTLNNIWYAGWTIPDEWENIQLIPIPER